MNRPLANLAQLTPNELKALETMRSLFQGEVYPDQHPTSWFQLEDWTYLRYLKARKFDVPKAELMLENTLDMRRKFLPHRLHESDPTLRVYLEEKWWMLLPPSKEGHTVQLTEGGLFDCNKITNDEDFYRYVLLTNELACREMAKAGWKSVGNIVLFDFREYSLLKQFSPKAMRYNKVLMEASDSHYPEMLSRVLLFNAPLVFRGPYKVMKPWLSEETQQKILFVSDNKVLDDLLTVESRVARHGGTRAKDYACIYYEEV
ncbi:hypothetical protein BASA81_010569 [Batrachochytrium salamandrivorans]|nr:hypothetical protein BASA81_010569 [Batrachochytrium salamandrivorans]